ncbi:Replicative DNA helicase, partial [termite gut metagenome]
DMVCFIHRPEYYKIYQDDKGRDLRGMAEIIVAKHRNGATGDVLLRFKGEFARFQNPDDDMIIPLPNEGGAVWGSRINTNSVPVPASTEYPIQNSSFKLAGEDNSPLPF